MKLFAPKRDTRSGGAAGRRSRSAGHFRGQPASPGTQRLAAPKLKPPPPLPLFFMLSHLEEDGPVRLDGVKLGVCEVMGLELDEPKLGAFAGALNACDFPVQLLIRQHPPRAGQTAGTSCNGGAAGQDLPPRTEGGGRVASHRLLTDLGGQGRHPRPTLLRQSPSSHGSTSCAACWRGPGCPSTP